MASDISTYLGNKIVRWLAGETFPAAPSDIYLAIFDGDPKSGGTEVTTDVASAGRIALDVTAPSSGTTNTMDTDTDVDFGASENDVNITHLAIFDASTSGNLLSSKVVPGSPISALTGAAVKVLAGDLSFTIGS